MSEIQNKSFLDYPGLREYDSKIKEEIQTIKMQVTSGLQTDWNETDSSSLSYLKNRPNEFKPSEHKHTVSDISNFPVSMPASDVSSWAKQSEKPSYSKSEIGLSNVINEKQYCESNPQPSVDKAIKDENGNVIVSTYATKTEIKNTTKEVISINEPTGQSVNDYWIIEN